MTWTGKQAYLHAIFACAAMHGAYCRAETPAPEPAGLFDRAVNQIEHIASDGNWDLLVSGYANHSNDTYTAKRRAKLNEKAWGGGVGKTLRNANGNDESVFAAAILDSNRHVQWSAGYAHQWIFPVASTGLEVGGGATALVIRRQDWFDGLPFPAVLPVFSLGTQKAKLTAVYVPHVSTRKGKGNVLLLFLKFSL